MKNKVKDSILLTVCDLPKDKIEGLGLSFRDIAQRGKKMVNEYLLPKLTDDEKKIIVSSTNVQESLIVQKKSRRILSNWVNNPKNLVNSEGKYIGDKYGAKITICGGDGDVIHYVETFCRDVKNKNNRGSGKNNNFIVYEQQVEKIGQLQRNISTLSNNNKAQLVNVNLLNGRLMMLKSNSPPSDLSLDSELLEYSLNKTGDDETVNIVSASIIEKHTTKKEFIEATTRRYGYDTRRSDTGFSFNWHVCRKWGDGDNLNESKETAYIRLSYFEFPAPTIIDVAVANGSFKKLVTAVKAAGLVETLSGPGPFTVFAPTDDAFNKFTPGALEALLADVPQLEKLLKYHVVAGKVMAADVVKLTFAKTLADGLNVSIRVENGKVFVNDSQVIFTDIPCANGVIHVINTVLSPQTTTYDLLVGSKKFKTLISVLDAAGLDAAVLATLSGTDPFTIFAPTDAAFAKLPAVTLAYYLNPDNLSILQELLKYHVVAGKVMAADIINAIADGSVTTYMTTLAVKSISVSMENGNVILNNSAKVTTTDVLGSNGVILIHVIDTVLIPPPVI